MKIIFFLFINILLFAQHTTKYMSNESCKECHETIYNEFQNSYHSKSYFNDELHHKVANAVSKRKYDCAVCHMPAANNLKDLITGKARPDKNNVTQSDAISCFFCHQIAFVKKAHKYNINTLTRQAADYKPSLFGRLKDPDENDKHSSINSPIYIQNVCVGCHSHKLNDNNVTIFKAMKKNQDSTGCVKCHMPMIKGSGAENMDKKARGQHVSHKFLGIHNKKMRKKSVDINISTTTNTITIKLTNKMGHPLIIQPARVKYFIIKIIRDGKTIWRNYKNSPREDHQAFFEYTFKNNKGKQVIIPSKATSILYNHNLPAKKTITIKYDHLNLKKGDKIIVSMYVRYAKKDCLKVLNLKDKNLKKSFLIKSITTTVK